MTNDKTVYGGPRIRAVLEFQSDEGSMDRLEDLIKNALATRNCRNVWVSAFRLET